MLTASVERAAEDAGSVGNLVRRRRWIAPGIQGRLLAWTVAASAVISTALAWIVLLVVWGPLANRIAWGNGAVDADVLFAQAATRVFLTTALMLVLFGALSLALGLLVWRRVAGPLHRIGQAAGRAAEKKYRERVTIRERDYIHDFADKFNRMMQQFEKEHAARQEALDAAEAQLAGMAEELASGRTSAEGIRGRIAATLGILRGGSARIEPEADDQVSVP